MDARMDKLLFGTAGIPTCCAKCDTVEGIREDRKLGLECFELEFVHSINITPAKAPEIGKAAKENGIILTCHAPYFVNLNAIEKAKIHASMGRIVNSAKILDLCGGYSVCYHPAYYLGMPPEQAHENVRKVLKEMMKKIYDAGIKVWVRPETTGKGSAYGNLSECIKLSQEFEQVLPCIDFAHLHARSNGKVNSYDEYCDVLALVEKELGKEALKNMHIHYSGINYSAKGELNHLVLKESDANWKDLLRAWKEFKIAGCVISESPNIEEDAMMMQKNY
jgi:deoxyribonuclease-4